MKMLVVWDLSKKTKLNWTEPKMMTQATKPQTSGFFNFLGGSFLFLLLRAAKKSPSSFAMLYSVKTQGKKAQKLSSDKKTESHEGAVNRLKYKSLPIGWSCPLPKGTNAAWTAGPMTKAEAWDNWNRETAIVLSLTVVADAT